MASRSVVEDFRRAVQAGDTGRLSELLAEDVRIYGVRHKPFEGKSAVLMVLGALNRVCQDIEYVCEYSAESGVALLMRGRVGDRQFDGASLIKFDEHGLITEFRDFLRPLSALLALQEAAGSYLANAAATPLSNGGVAIAQ